MASCHMSLWKDPSDWIDEAADLPHRLFLRTPAGRNIGYAELREQSGRIALALRSRGVLPGDRVAAQVDKSPEAVLLYVACLRMGAIFVPINTANTTNEVEHFLRDSQPRVIIMRPSEFTAVAPLAQQAGVMHVETLGTNGEGSLTVLAGECNADFQSVKGDASSTAAIIYTSGTTGRSKGAMLTRANLASNALALADAWHFSESDVLLHALPLFHIHGLFVAINTVLASGSSLILLPKFDAMEVLTHLREATVYMGVPTHYARLLQQIELNRETTTTIRVFISGSAPLYPRRTGRSCSEPATRYWNVTG